MDISLTGDPVITASYLESHHKVGVVGGWGRAQLPQGELVLYCALTTPSPSFNLMAAKSSGALLRIPDTPPHS